MSYTVTSLKDIRLILKSFSGAKVSRYTNDINIYGEVSVKSNEYENESNHIYGKVAYVISLEVRAEVLGEVFHFEDPIEVCEIVVDDTEVFSVGGLLQSDDMNQGYHHYMKQLTVLIDQQLDDVIVSNYDMLKKMYNMRRYINVCFRPKKGIDL
ncbi:hypothetical protein [Mammaliicoccus vitulinus]|uniref:hypothetical protein n=1 Tax=Mammaliicoccus vitulinus TaxID=71237 RepID=UPI00248C509F|nr:hypothetical protein [Mammaliicoccus vitulinus]